MNASPILFAASLGTLGVLSVVLVLAAYRLIRGPHLADRVIALDLLAVLAIGMMASLAVLMDRPVLLDASLVLALLAFLGTVAFSRYLERQS